MMPDFGEQVVRWLAVIGGGALGGVLGSLLAKLGVRLTGMRRKPPPAAVNILRILGAAVLGIAVYLLVFGPGGTGLGLGPGFGLGGPGTNGTATGTAPEIQPRPATGTTGTAKEGRPVLTVEMLGGERYKGENRPHLDKDRDRFYLVEGEARTWDEVRQMIRQRKKELKELDIIIRQKGSVAEEHEAVQELKRLARDEDLEVRVVKPAGE